MYICNTAETAQPSLALLNTFLSKQHYSVQV